MTDAEIRESKKESIRELLEGKSLIIASNRGPVEFRSDEDDEIVPNRGAGGLVSALESALQATRATWVASAMTPEDETVATEAGDEGFPAPPDDPLCNMRMVITSQRAYHRYYNVISNLLLWFMQHYLWDIPYWPLIDQGTHNAFQEGYREVNRLFAREIVKAASSAEGEPVVMLQDYHLYLCATYIRDKMPGARILHFTHIPWCQPDYLRLLPPYMKDEIIEGLLSCDVVSFHTWRYVRNFLWCCRELTDHEVNLDTETVRVGDRRVRVRHHPISIDAEYLSEMAESEEVTGHRRGLQRLAVGKKKILRVDRVEFSKNILRGFKVYRRFLELYHDWWGKVLFIAYLYPSRLGLARYRQYKRDIEAEVEALNEEFSTKAWQPVVLRIEDNYPQSIAGLCEYDVLLVNPLFDGMNLVSKEGAVLNERNGVVILSENAGSYDELKDWVIAINPFDIEEGARALNDALVMEEEEKSRRASELATAVRDHTAEDWLLGQLRDVTQD